MQRFGNVLLHTRTAKRKGELSSAPVRQDRVKQILWWDDGAQSQTKVLREVGGASFIDELGMADGIHSILIDPRVEGSVVHIPDFLIDSNLVIKVGGIGASSKEGVARIHGFNDRKGFDELSHARICLLLLLPLTFPEGHDMVSQASKTLKAFHGGTSDIIHTTIVVTAVRFVTIGETRKTPVPKTTQELEDRVGVWIEAVHPPTSTRDLVFALVASMLDTLVWKRVFLLHPMFLPQQPFHSGLGVIGDESPSLDRFGGDGLFLHAVKAIVMQTSSCNRHFVKGTKAGLFAELTTKGQTSLSEEFDVRDTVVHKIPLDIKLCLVRHLSRVALLKLRFSFGGHGFRGVHLSRRHGTHIVGVRKGVEKMWKIPLLEMVGIQPKCFGKRSQSHGEERHGVDEANVPTPVSELQQFATRTHGLKLLFALDQTLHHKVRVVTLEIVSVCCERVSCSVNCSSHSRNCSMQFSPRKM